ncbi:hypothetical protein F5878DRAFT_637611 [Lentinula raphanica]|uniref:F-box domain-containing protein n=1 Tax=Lentinula raphanica TaxID=153919 RepID=A0AA38UJW4_9AGAR|nr:hypothetical protein F5878DRAFT_637611 [Lentinula raphanica]
MAMHPLEASLDSLPLELLETIISFVDRRTLPSCALVCKRWVPASRETLFSSLSLPNDLRTRSFLNLLDNGTPSTFIDAHIKHLDLSSSPRSDIGSDSERVITSWASRTPKTRATLQAVFGHLNSLSVRFASVWVTPDDPNQIWFKTITTLRLEFVIFEDELEFQGLIQSLPGLRSLELSSVEVTLIGSESAEESSNNTSQLRSLSITYMYDPATLALVAPFCGNLAKFEYDWHSQQYSSARSIPGVGAILRAAKDTLEELSLKTGSWSEGKNYDEGIDKLFKTHLELASLPSLRRLALDVSTIYLLPILRRLASAYDAQRNELSTPDNHGVRMKSLPTITHLYIPAVGYKSSFQTPNEAELPANNVVMQPTMDQESVREDNDVQPTGSAPVFHDLNKNLHEALEVLLPIHPVFEELVELRCDVDDIFNAADFAIASSTQFFQSQYFWRLRAKEAKEASSAEDSRHEPYSTFIPHRPEDNFLDLKDEEDDADAELEVLHPNQFSLGSASLQRYPRPGTLSHSRLSLHIRKLRKRMPLCAARGITPIPVVRYWFNDVPTGLVFEEKMWASGDGYASINNAGGWDVSASQGGVEEIAAVQEEEDPEVMGGMQGLTMKGMEIWDAGKGRVLFVLFLLSTIIYLW